ncbi:MAG TPA: hypothetical protein VFU36_16055, partial [Jatrophihabitans sp.]|nr:hypothetical protein [Jatrophihabitans sp.]
MLHRAAYAALGLTGWRYEAIDCAEADLLAVLAEHPDAAGFSATMPLKRAVLRVAARISPMAAAIGAGNTLLPDAPRLPGESGPPESRPSGESGPSGGSGPPESRSSGESGAPGGWYAENTDWLGIRDALAERGVTAERAVLL